MKFIVPLVFASCCFAGSVTVTGPGVVSSKDDASDVKAMHQYFQDFSDALKRSMANSPKDELKGDWKVQLTLFHGSANNLLFPEYMEIQLTGGQHKSIATTIRYVSVSKTPPADLAGVIGKILWNYMTTERLGAPSLPAPRSAAIVWPSAGRFFWFAPPSAFFCARNLCAIIKTYAQA